jgi:hypothetical protein
MAGITIWASSSPPFEQLVTCDMYGLMLGVHDLPPFDPLAVLSTVVSAFVDPMSQCIAPSGVGQWP